MNSADGIEVSAGESATRQAGRSLAATSRTPEREESDGPGTNPVLLFWTSSAMCASSSGAGILQYLLRMAVARLTRSCCVPVISLRIFAGLQAVSVKQRSISRVAFTGD